MHLGCTFDKNGMEVAREKDYTFSMALAQLRTPENLRGKDGHGVLYNELIKSFDKEEILVIQRYPVDWARKIKITVKSEEVKNEALRRGIQMFGYHVSVKDENELLTRVILQNLSAKISDSAIQVALSQYGECVRVEHEYVWSQGYKTDVVTGTRFAYMSVLREAIPVSLEIKPDEKIVSVAKVIYRRGSNLETESQQPTQNVQACFSCGKSGHLISECPDKQGHKKTDDAFVFHNAKCPLSVWNTEYPFKVDGKEYICVDQYVLEQKCLKFGDSDTAARICNETDPKIMRRLGEKINGTSPYNHEDWREVWPYAVGQACQAKFTDPSASGAKDFLLDTGDLVIAESSRNKYWGTGIHTSCDNALDMKSWDGENILGQILMHIRSEIRKSQSHAEAVSKCDAETPRPQAPQRQALGDTTQEKNQSPCTQLSQEISVESNAPPSPPTRTLVAYGDSNMRELQLADPVVPLYSSSYSIGEMSLSAASQAILDCTIDGDNKVDDNVVDLVVIHAGTHEWNSEHESIPTATQVFNDYQKLLNVVCRRFPAPLEVIISSVPLHKPDGVHDDRIALINAEIVRFNAMLAQVETDEQFFTFVNNANGLYIDPTLESLYDDSVKLNQKGCLILADNLKQGIADAFAKTMLEVGVDYQKWSLVFKSGEGEKPRKPSET